MISFRQKGDFSKLTRFLERAKEAVHIGDLDKFGKEGVAALASATPVDSGETANSWYYEIENRKGSVTISFHNSNVQNGESSPTGNTYQFTQNNYSPKALSRIDIYRQTKNQFSAMKGLVGNT